MVASPAQGDSKESVMSKTQKQWHLELQQKWQLRSSPVFFSLSSPVFCFCFFFISVSLFRAIRCNPFWVFVFPRGCARRTGKNGGFVVEQSKVKEQPPPSPVFSSLYSPVFSLSLSLPLFPGGMGGRRNFKCQKGRGTEIRGSELGHVFFCS